MERQDRVTKALREHGAFFAFSDEQFDEQKVEGTKYASLGSGIICPNANVTQFVKDLKKSGKQRIKEDLAKNTKSQIIQRELANHEASYTGEIDDTIDALKGYGISDEEVAAEYKIYFAHQCEHNLI